MDSLVPLQVLLLAEELPTVGAAQRMRTFVHRAVFEEFGATGEDAFTTITAVRLGLQALWKGLLWIGGSYSIRNSIHAIPAHFKGVS